MIMMKTCRPLIRQTCKKEEIVTSVDNFNKINLNFNTAQCESSLPRPDCQLLHRLGIQLFSSNLLDIL